MLEHLPSKREVPSLNLITAKSFGFFLINCAKLLGHVFVLSNSAPPAFPICPK
jgi:hypothetical protein